MLLFASLTAWGSSHSRQAAQINELSKFSFFLRDIHDAEPSNEERRRLEAVGRVNQKSDEQLTGRLQSMVAQGAFGGNEAEPILNELARRKLVGPLQQCYSALMNRPNEPDHRPPDNLELLTALRRAQCQPDPLSIEVKVAEDIPWNHDPNAVLIEATITNVDVGRESCLLAQGLDDRGGRRERWKVILTDAENRRVADSNYFPFGGGGIGTHGPLAPGETGTWRNVLDLRRYVAPPRSGKYRMQVFTHNEVSIASVQNLDGLIVSKSEPISVTVINPHDPATEWLPTSVRPIAAIFAMGLVMWGASFYFTRRNPRDNPGALRFVRDTFWFLLVVSVASGYWFDDRRQSAVIAAAQPHSEADWSLVVEPSERR